MNRLLVSLLALVSPVFAQFASPSRTAAAISLDQPHLSFDLVRSLERQFDGKLADAPVKQPFDVIGPARGLYLQGTGIVLTAELELMATPRVGGPFKRTISTDEKAQIHARKLEQLLVLQQVMRETMAAAAHGLDIMPENERVVVAVRLWYWPWEDTSRLPTQILMTADRKSAMAGQIKEESSK